MQFDDDVIRLVEISGRVLKTYLACENPDAVIDSYFEERRSWPLEGVVNELYHRMPWDVACAIYFTQVVKGNLAYLGKWQTDNGLSRPPQEAIDYIKRHWWNITQS